MSLITRDTCIRRDQQDPLAHKRAAFTLTPGEIYLDGNSLGALVSSVGPRMQRAVTEEWGRGLIRSWNDANWYPAPLRVGAAIAGLIGAQPHEVVACDSTSVNLFKVLVAALRMRPGRKLILGELGNFPTDMYVASGVAALMGAEMRCVEPDEIESAIEAAGDSLAVVTLTEVNYKTGRLYDMRRITAAAHRAGGVVAWDLAHSAGTLPVQLDACHADFAVGCGYKYLNGGPGAPAFVFVAERHLAGLQQPIAGWHGHAQPFAFEQDYQPHAGIDRMLVGTASQLGLIALEEALTVFDGVDLLQLRRKGSELGDLFIALVDQELGGHGFGLASPRDAAQRGSQVSLTHEHGYPIMQAIIARGVIGDFRAPDILRFGFAGLYVRYVDIWDAVAVLKEVMQTRGWDRPEFTARKAVT
jgi:kynureninase